MFKKHLGEPSVAGKDVFIAFFLLFNAFAWHFMQTIMIENVQSGLTMTHTQNLIVWTAYYMGIVGSSIVGSLLSRRVSQFHIFYLWIILGVCASSIPALSTNFSVMDVSILSALLGVSLGLGFPSCLAYFADYTGVENRGRVGGMIFFITNISAPLLVIPLRLLNSLVSSIIFAAWRGSALLVFFLKPKEKITSEINRDPSFLSIFNDKSFFLYFIAWFMFCLIDRLEKPIVIYSSGDLYYATLIMGPVIGSISALLGGLLSDMIGRKRVVLYGFATLGITYAIVGIAPAAFVSWYFFIFIGSISTGILWVLFFLTLWGDLSPSGAREKYYVIGIAPYFLTGVVRLFSAPYVTLIPAASAFSLASFFLFLAVLPLLYAPETFPERKIELRRLRKYVEKARKAKEKYE